MMYLAFMKHKNFNNGLLRIFYRDGVYYFMLLSGFAIANIIANTTPPVRYPFNSGLQILTPIRC